MDRLIKDIIDNNRVNKVLENNGFKYVGQLLVIHEHSLMKKPGIGKEAINVIASALYSNKYSYIGSRQAYELPSIVLRHMADLAEDKERKEQEAKDRFFEEHCCTSLEWIEKSLSAMEDDD